uniref:Uncharacterized protein n=1 Tax=viral metagenome TaxID=1070528 RepID=A0A6C0KZH8_9ZZZZ
MESIYIINHTHGAITRPIAILEDRILVDGVMKIHPWHFSPMGLPYMEFSAVHYYKEPCGVLQLVGTLDYSHLAPPPRLARPPWRPHSNSSTSVYSFKNTMSNKRK